MDLEIDQVQKVPDVRFFPPELQKEMRPLAISLILSMLLLIGVSQFFADKRAASLFIVGGILLSVNVIFYAFISAVILIKKNIAWMGPVIVIKYLILIGSVYLIWAQAEVLWFLAGMFIELFLIITFFVVIKKWLSRRDIGDGSL